MNHTTRLLSLATLVTLTACGGGGDAAQDPTINGTFEALSGSILPDPATSTQTVEVQVGATF